jgi:death-associated protein kinase
MLRILAQGVMLAGLLSGMGGCSGDDEGGYVSVEAFLAAIKENDSETVRRGLASDPDRVRMRKRGNHQTPLHLAVVHDAPDVARALLEAGADVEALDSVAGTPLALAARLGSVRSAEVLVNRGGADVEHAPGMGDWTPLTIAASWGQSGMARLLITHGARVDHQVANGQTALHAAAHHGELEVAKALLEADCDVTIKSRKGETALAVARRRGEQRIVELLRRHGATE